MPDRRPSFEQGSDTLVATVGTLSLLAGVQTVSFTDGDPNVRVGPGTPETLFVVSSDLSHYLDDASARRMDAATCAAIERLDGQALDYDSACGRIPLRGLLRVARERRLGIETLDLRTVEDAAAARSIEHLERFIGDHSLP